jgi:3-oxoacyl-[acyl-carrier-protein] synthase-3
MKNPVGSLMDIAVQLPARILTNNELELEYPAWNVPQTALRVGVQARHIAAKSETALDLALVATRKLLDRHKGLENAIDGILFCTQTPDYLLPSNAFLLQKELGLRKEIIALDFNLACSGFVYGLAMGLSFLRSGMARNLLLVTADTYSKLLKNDDRSTRMLFGDGAAVSWLSIDSAPFEIHPLISSFDRFSLSSDGEGWHDFIIRSGGARQPERMPSGYGDRIEMNGLSVLNFVNDRVLNQLRELLKVEGLKQEDLAQCFFHQASGLALDSLRKRLKLRENQMFSNLDFIGNTVSASIPILMNDFFEKHSLVRGDRVLVSGFGVGYSWGSVLATI